MINLKTNYLGLELKNPIIVGSCGLTNSVENIEEIARNGAGAVVLKSLFEEQINIQVAKAMGASRQSQLHAESEDYVTYFEKMHLVEEYLKLVKNTKERVDIPVIASINCHTNSEWVEFAGRIEKAGADALELNIFMLPSNPNSKEVALEESYLEIIRSVREHVSIPLSLKIGYYFDNLARALRTFSRADIEGLVLFNRFYSPDIDIYKLTPKAGSAYSTSEEIHISLRWIAIASDFVECDLCASTGIHNGEGVVKQLLAGAKAVQMVSAIYKHKPIRISESLDFLNNWMKKHKFTSIESFRGKVSRQQLKDPVVFERVQYLRYMSEVTGK
ncbi:MAG: dihydroorotate dehydrogenase-like protein [Candidatus Cloacimonetes bacterium]|nr:dihydroorotate dehydrogenase-like protein [Candidatus Cloacimonadota bacterium]